MTVIGSNNGSIIKIVFTTSRVRIEVLRAIGNRITNGQRLAYCVATHAKPYLSVGPATGSSTGGMSKDMKPDNHTLPFLSSIMMFSCKGSVEPSDTWRL